MASNVISHVLDYELLKPYLEVVPLESGKLQVTSEYQDTWHIKNEVRLVLVSSGICTVSSPNRKYTLCQNDIFFMFRDEKYSLHSTTKETTELWWVDLQGQGVSALLNQIPINETNRLIKGIPNPGLFRELNSLVLHSSDMSVGDALNNISAAYRILSVLITECSNTAWTVVSYHSPEIIYTGVWSRWPSPSGRQHNECYTGTSRSYAEFNFYGTGIRWFGTLNFDCGRADVLIDGVYQTTVDAYNPSRLPKQLLYSNTHLPLGHHIIKVFCTGQANSRAINCDVVVESFHYCSSSAAKGINEPVRSAFQSGLVKQAAQYIKLNYARELSIDQLAKEMGVSRPYLTSRFNTELGISPMQYISNQRLSEAKRLLISGDMPVYKIAANVGFKDAYYFSRFFKKNEGMTPSQYREQNKNQ